MALLGAGQEFDQRSSLQGISQHLLLQSSHETIFSASDYPGLTNTLVDDGTVRKSDQKVFRFVEPGYKGKLKLSLSRSGEMTPTGSTVGVGREEDHDTVITDNQGLQSLLFLFNVVQT